MKVNILNKSSNALPAYATPFSSGMDIRAYLESPFILKKNCRALIKTGLYLEIPNGYEAQIRSRSGLSIKKGIAVLNSPGTIDSDYRGEVGVILINHSDNDFTILNGDRIAQMVISPYINVSLCNVNSLDPSQRGDGGFGSTGFN